jgi:hypothetical protein
MWDMGTQRCKGGESVNKASMGMIVYVSVE